MRTRQELESIKSFVDNTYSSFGNSILTVTRPLNLKSPELGYCFKYSSDSKDVFFNVYKIVTSPIGIERTDFRILMHEYGHIYLGHLDGIHEELDSRVCDVLQNYREELIERINTSCGIDFADKLLERVIDDSVLNHSLHNIAMDMEVNSTILSKDDIEEIEADITSILPKTDEELLEYLKDKAPTEEVKKRYQDQLDKLRNESKIKLILPCRYYLDKDVPFPDNLSYPEYLLLIIEHLDQFVKMMVSIANGGNGDTSSVSSEDVQNALNGSSSGQGQCTGQTGQGSSGDAQQGNTSGQGGSDGMAGFDNLLEKVGISENKSGNDGSGEKDGEKQDGDKDGNGGSGSEKDEQESPYKGKRPGSSSDGSDGKDSEEEGLGGSHKDHRTDSRDEADRKRELGEIVSKGGLGCGSSGKPDITREVTETDEIDMALDEVMLNYKSKVIKVDCKKENLYLYNRGINRSVITPIIKRKVTQSTEPTIVFLIDVSGSMDTRLVDRILNTIAKKMKKIGRGLKYNIITWSTDLGEHIQDIDPRKGVPRISTGGGTRMARGITYFKENYGPEAVLILISDFEDYLEEWHEIEEKMPQYTMWGFNYGREYKQEFTNFKVRNFKNSYGY